MIVRSHGHRVWRCNRPVWADRQCGCDGQWIAGVLGELHDRGGQQGGSQCRQRWHWGLEGGWWTSSTPSAMRRVVILGMVKSSKMPESGGPWHEPWGLVVEEAAVWGVLLWARITMSSFRWLADGWALQVDARVFGRGCHTSWGASPSFSIDCRLLQRWGIACNILDVIFLEEGNPSRSVTLMLWTLGRCRRARARLRAGLRLQVQKAMPTRWRATSVARLDTNPQSAERRPVARRARKEPRGWTMCNAGTASSTATMEKTVGRRRWMTRAKEKEEARKERPNLARPIRLMQLGNLRKSRSYRTWTFAPLRTTPPSLELTGKRYVEVPAEPDHGRGRRFGRAGSSSIFAMRHGTASGPSSGSGRRPLAVEDVVVTPGGTRWMPWTSGERKAEQRWGEIKIEEGKDTWWDIAVWDHWRAGRRPQQLRGGDGQHWQATHCEVERWGLDWIRLNYDWGADSTVIPGDGHMQGLNLGRVGDYRVVNGGRIPRYGRVRVPCSDEQGGRRGFKATVTHVHKPKPLGWAGE